MDYGKIFDLIHSDSVSEEVKEVALNNILEEAVMNDVDFLQEAICESDDKVNGYVGALSYLVNSSISNEELFEAMDLMFANESEEVLERVDELFKEDVAKGYLVQVLLEGEGWDTFKSGAKSAAKGVGMMAKEAGQGIKSFGQRIGQGIKSGISKAAQALKTHAEQARARADRQKNRNLKADPNKGFRGGNFWSSRPIGLSGIERESNKKSFKVSDKANAKIDELRAQAAEKEAKRKAKEASSKSAKYGKGIMKRPTKGKYAKKGATGEPSTTETPSSEAPTETNGAPAEPNRPNDEKKDQTMANVVSNNVSGTEETQNNNGTDETQNNNVIVKNKPGRPRKVTTTETNEALGEAIASLTLSTISEASYLEMLDMIGDRRREINERHEYFRHLVAEKLGMDV